MGPSARPRNGSAPKPNAGLRYQTWSKPTPDTAPAGPDARWSNVHGVGRGLAPIPASQMRPPDDHNPVTAAPIHTWEPFPDIETYNRQMLAIADRDLVKRAKARDREAFDELVGPLVGQAFRLAFGMLHDRGSAEDAVQEAAVRAWRRLNNLRPDTPLRPWFLAIVANQCRTVMRARWWSVVRLDRIEESAGAGFEDRIVRGADIRAALRTLATDQREVLVLRYYLDLPLEEVAAITGVPVGTVKSRISRGLAAMRPHFDAVEALT